MSWHRHSHHHRHRRRRSAYGPWEMRARFFGPGEVRLALLSLLEEQPRHGYELMKGLEARSNHTYRASAGTIYPTLQQLEDEALVRSEPVDGKRVYHITEAGRRELERESDAVEDIWRRADEWGSWGGMWDPDATELMRPAMRLMKAALRSLAGSDDPNRVDAIAEILKDARRRIRDLDSQTA